jgi:nucleoside-diphosphate-sugar epimerase
LIVVSSQYVAGPSRLPENDEDYFPHTVYGQSKVITEQLTRQANLGCVWTLVRPTNIWGPWHMRYRREVWRVIDKGMYMHPGWKPVVRSYGYVGNIVWQMDRILKAPKEIVNQQVFYLGDRPDDIYRWVNAFSMAQQGKSVRRVPRYVLAPIGWVGDLLADRGKSFPLTSSRFRNMVSDYPTPMDRTFETFGSPPHSLVEGVRETVNWLDRVGWE